MYCIIYLSYKRLVVITGQTVLLNTRINSAFFRWRVWANVRAAVKSLKAMGRPSHESEMFWCFPKITVPTQRDKDEKTEWDRNPRLTSLFVERASVSMTGVSWGKQFPTREVRSISPRRREKSRVSLGKPRQPCLCAGRAPKTQRHPANANKTA